MTKAKIRAFRPGDLDTVLEIAVIAWQPIFDSAREIVGDELFEIVSPDPDSRKRNSVAKACEADDPREVWIAEIDSEIAGFITVDMNYDEGVAEIGNNAIAHKFHGNGLGTQMYRFVIEQMRSRGKKAAIVTTGTDDAHAPARRAYESVGFSAPLGSVQYHIEM